MWFRYLRCFSILIKDTSDSSLTMSCLYHKLICRVLQLKIKIVKIFRLLSSCLPFYFSIFITMYKISIVLHYCIWTCLWNDILSSIKFRNVLIVKKSYIIIISFNGLALLNSLIFLGICSPYQPFLSCNITNFKVTRISND